MAKYIDSDAAIALAKDIIVPTGSGDAYRHRCIDPQDLAELPAADVVERKTGKWIEIKRNDVNPITGKCGVYVGCSECGAPLPTDSMLDFINESDCKFCYNCGTKMEVLIN